MTTKKPPSNVDALIMAVWDKNRCDCGPVQCEGTEPGFYLIPMDRGAWRSICFVCAHTPL